ncbi:hypothetical protein [Spirulina sp. 06S082]|uniref:hypothetical protein n=1 Tax=Spirulina sp. 06S082 TaxID=3110248 RepID=UPI002B20B876|nr:hypothetical protein [Spirulina sp. 06S082]MEA5469254.1 hypothetical protein [Spirulina sp. 06S082]
MLHFVTNKDEYFNYCYVYISLSYIPMAIAIGVGQNFKPRQRQGRMRTAKLQQEVVRMDAGIPSDPILRWGSILEEIHKSRILSIPAPESLR